MAVNAEARACRHSHPAPVRAPVPHLEEPPERRLQGEAAFPAPKSRPFEAHGGPVHLEVVARPGRERHPELTRMLHLPGGFTKETGTARTAVNPLDGGQRRPRLREK